MTERWAVPAEANLPPASLRGWCSEVTPLGRRAQSVCVWLFIYIKCNLCVCSSMCAFHSPLFPYEFLWLHNQFKYSFLALHNLCIFCVTLCVCIQKYLWMCVFVVECTVLYFQPLPPPPLPVPRPTSAPWRCVGVREYGERNTGRPHSTTWKEF